MIAYAEVGDFPNTNIPIEVLPRLIHLASTSILRATRNSVYKATPDHYPVDTELRDAMRKACIAQVEILHSSGVGLEMTSGQLPEPKIESGNINGAALTFSSDEAKTMRQYLINGHLCALAESYLENVGLLPGELPGVHYL